MTASASLSTTSRASSSAGRRGFLAGLLASALLPNAANAVVGTARAGLIASKVVYDPDALLWKAAVVTAGGTVSDARLALVSNLISGLKTAGVWSKLDRLWLLAAENTQSALIDLVARSSASAVNSPTFATDRGYTGNGTTSYLDTGFNYGTAGGHYTDGDQSYGVYIRTNRTVGANYASMGCNDWNTFWPFYGDSKLYYFVGGNSSTNAAATAQGMWVLSRTASTASAVYMDGASYASLSSTNQTKTIYDFLILTAPTNASGGNPAEFSQDQHAAAFIGGGLTSTDASNLSASINTYMTAIGASVY